MNKVIESSSFKNFQSQEKLGRFNKSAIIQKMGRKKFFYLGVENKWKKLLDKNICNEIEKRFSLEIKELECL